MKKVIVLIGIIGTFVFGHIALSSKSIPVVHTTLSKDFLAHNITVIDIRSPDEYAMTGILPGSYLLSFHEEEAFISKLSLLVDKEKPIAILSQSGEDSSKVAWLLNAKGFKHITNLVGGVEQGIKNGIRLVF